MKAQAEFYGGPWDGEVRSVEFGGLVRSVPLSTATSAARTEQWGPKDQMLGEYVGWYDIRLKAVQYEWHPA